MRQLNGFLAQLKAELEALPRFTCTRCGETFQGVEAPTCWDCNQAEIRRVDARRKAEADLAAVDQRFRHATLESYAIPPGDREALRAVSRWQPEGDRGLFLWGAPGAGKSHLAFAKARALIAGEHRVFAAEWVDLLHRIRATYDGRPGETESDIHAAMERADVVLIDDFLAGKTTEWAAEQAWAVVHSRYQSGRPLILTSNFSLGDLAGRIGGVEGKRIASRLAEMTQRVEVRARDYRLHGGDDR